MKKNYIFKLLAVLSVLALICVCSVPSFAANKTVKVKVEIAGSDGLLYVRLTAPASSDIATFSAPLNFDKEKLEFQEISFLEDASLRNVTDEERTEEGIVDGDIIIANSLTEETKIMTYIFKIREGAEGSVNFGFGNIAATDSNDQPITIIPDGVLSATISELEPLTPDKLQTSFDANNNGGTSSQGNPTIPNTTNKAITVSVVGVLAAAGIAAGAVAIKKKKDEE